MNTKTGAILLVAGTCIGSGMIALPLVLSPIGIIPSAILMIAIWYIMYYTSLVNLELNLQAGEGLTLGDLGRKYSGKKAEYIGTICLKLLSYSLLAVFIYGGSSIIQKLLETQTNFSFSFNLIVFSYTFVIITLLLLPIRWIDYCNRLLFICLLGVVTVIVLGLTIAIDWKNLPLFNQKSKEISVLASLLPVVFTSFGFQVIFHTLTNYCNRQVKVLKSAFFWGSLIPAIVYIAWTTVIVTIIYQNDPTFYGKIISGKAEIGELIHSLSQISHWQSIQIFIWWISILAIGTSILGVGVGLCDSLQTKLPITNGYLRRLVATLLAIIPSAIIVVYIPNAFTTILGFAGMILAIIAIILPIYLLLKIKNKSFFYREVKWKSFLILSIAIGLIIVLSELYNMS